MEIQNQGKKYSVNMEDNVSNDADSKRSFRQRIKSLFRFSKPPDTTEELEHEIQELLEEGEEQGLISSHEERLINSIFDFRETVASEIMTPAAEMICADQATSVGELRHLITEEGHTRIPIFKDNQDNIIGILHAKDLLRFCDVAADEVFDLHEFLNPPAFIPESKLITDLLRDFQSQKNHMAIVNDEFGGVRGLVTLEDVIEEIVGEIDDEHDQEGSELRVVEDRTILVDAKIDFEEVEEYFHCNLPSGPYESVGGLIIHKLGRVPKSGTTLTVAQLTFKVLAVDRRRIKTVRISKN